MFFQYVTISCNNSFWRIYFSHLLKGSLFVIYLCIFDRSPLVNEWFFVLYYKMISQGHLILLLPKTFKDSYNGIFSSSWIETSHTRSSLCLIHSFNQPVLTECLLWIRTLWVLSKCIWCITALWGSLKSNSIGYRVLLFVQASQNHNLPNVPSIAGMTGTHINMPSFFHRDEVLLTFLPSLAWNQDPPDLNLPVYLGWQVCTTTLSYWLRWGPHWHFAQLVSNHNPPSLCLPSS
jgi:hypothetical protein